MLSFFNADPQTSLYDYVGMGVWIITLNTDIDEDALIGYIWYIIDLDYLKDCTK